MNGLRATLAGVGMGISGLVLSVSAALVADMSRANQEAQGDQADVVREIAQLRRSIENDAQETTCAPLSPVRVVWQGRARPVYQDVETVAATDDVGEELAPIREAALTGEISKVKDAIAQHNAHGGTRVLLNDDPEVEKLGIAVRARYDARSHFGVVLEADCSSEVQEPVTVLVAPGSIVKATPGFQDTAPIQARFLKLVPRGHAEERATICCAAIHSEDPRSTNPRGIYRHEDPRVARVAATAERTHADWGTAQVALWAVANDASRDDVRKAPGAYLGFVDGARNLLEKAGVDTRSLALYQGEPQHRAPTRGLGLDALGLGLQGG